MRVANLVACLVLAALVAGAMAVANRLGFVGLALIGLATAFFCDDAAANEHYVHPRLSRLSPPSPRARSPEQKAAEAAERDGTGSAYRFYKRCGLFLVAVGAAGFIWQSWLAAPPP